MSYFFEWGGVLIAPAIVGFLLVPGLVLIALVVALMVLAVVVVALAAAILATPYVLGSFLHTRWRALRAAGRRPAFPGALHHDANRV